MKTGQVSNPWRALRNGLILLSTLLVGCATERESVEKRLHALQLSKQIEVSAHYYVACPDVLDIQLPHHPHLSKKYEVEPDGRIDLGDYGQPRVEGREVGDIALILATQTGSDPEKIHVRVAEFRSQYLLIFGEVTGQQRTVPYRGQETVLDLLKRIGGITPGAASKNVYVVRAHLSDDQRPEVFHIDLDAIVLKQDQKTNIRLLPNDQIHVGATRQSEIEHNLPPWLRGTFQTLLNTKMPFSNSSKEKQ